MIEIAKSKPYRMCNCCNSNEDIYEIYFRSEHQGTGVALCNQCRQELIEKLNKITEEIPWAELEDLYERINQREDQV